MSPARGKIASVCSAVFLVPIFSIAVFGQSLLSVLESQLALSNFTSYLQSNTNLLTKLSNFSSTGAGFTVLAPTNQAFENFFTSQSSATGNFSSGNATQLEALLTYQVLQGVHPAASFGEQPQFIPTLLTSPKYANVTGGQRVQATYTNGSVTFRSAVNTTSRITTSDIIYGAGLINVIDAVLEPPSGLFDTISEAGLEYFIQILGDEYLKSSYEALLAELATDANMTFFCVNSAEYNEQAFQAGELTAFTPQELTQILEYYILEGTVAYSSSMTNGTRFKTVHGEDVTITVQNGSTYINSARIIQKDLLVWDGVIQVIDSGLNFTQPGARPPPIASPSSQSSTGLSTGAKAGIGIGVALGVVALVVLAYCLWRKGSKRPRAERSTQAEMSENVDDWRELPIQRKYTAELDGSASLVEVDGQSKVVHEVEAKQEQR